MTRQCTALPCLVQCAMEQSASLWLYNGLFGKRRIALLFFAWRCLLLSKVKDQLCIARQHRFNVIRYRLLRFAFSALRWNALHCWNRDTPEIPLHSFALLELDSHFWFYFIKMLAPQSIRQLRAVNTRSLTNTTYAQHRLAVHTILHRPALVWVRAGGALMQLAPPLTFDPSTAPLCVVEFL